MPYQRSTLSMVYITIIRHIYIYIKSTNCDMQNRNERKIAFLFTVKKNPIFPNIWDDFFRGNEGLFTIYIHPETPEITTWRRESIISEISEDSAGNNVGAYIALFKAALMNDKNYKFVTLSENCLPIKPFMVLYNFLNKNNNSLVKRLNISESDYETIISDNIVDVIGKYNLMRHYTSISLSRAHVTKLLSTLTVNVFRKMTSGDEYFLSAINTMRNYEDMAITFDNWQYLNRHINIIQRNIIKTFGSDNNTDLDFAYLDKMIGLYGNLYNEVLGFKKITVVSNDELEKMRHTESFFYKEFDKNSDIEKYISTFI
jgi:hypothetical protein